MHSQKTIFAIHFVEVDTFHGKYYSCLATCKTTYKNRKTTIEVMSIVIICPAGSNPNRKKRQQKLFEDIKGECIEL